MSAPKKGSRVISVDGVKYRWRVRPKPTYSQECERGGFSFSVEAADSPGSVLVVDCAGPRHDGIFAGDGAVTMTPARVAAYVRRALAEGWNPGRPGKQFSLAGDA